MDRNPTETTFRRELANAVRFLAIDAVDQAKSGHPGAPMGMAEMAVALWTRHLRHNPADPQWWDRDRFVLSKGHGPMAYYAVLAAKGFLPPETLDTFGAFDSPLGHHPENQIPLRADSQQAACAVHDNRRPLAGSTHHDRHIADGGCRGDGQEVPVAKDFGNFTSGHVCLLACLSKTNIAFTNIFSTQKISLIIYLYFSCI